MEVEKKLAGESEKTKRARAKLQKKLEAIDQKITPQAIERKTVEIHRWIARHVPQRIVLKTKTISLFDENKNTADVSQKISAIMINLQKELDQNNAAKK